MIFFYGELKPVFGWSRWSIASFSTMFYIYILMNFLLCCNTYKSPFYFPGCVKLLRASFIRIHWITDPVTPRVASFSPFLSRVTHWMPSHRNCWQNIVSFFLHALQMAKPSIFIALRILYILSVLLGNIVCLPFSTFNLCQQG